MMSSKTATNQKYLVWVEVCGAAFFVIITVEEHVDQVWKYTNSQWLPKYKTLLKNIQSFNLLMRRLGEQEDIVASNAIHL